MNKQKYIDAIMDAFGFTKAEAVAYYRRCLKENKTKALELLVEGYEEQAKRGFMED